MTRIRLEFEWVIFLSFLLRIEFDTISDTRTRIWLEFEWVIFDYDTNLIPFLILWYHFWSLSIMHHNTTFRIISLINFESSLVIPVLILTSIRPKYTLWIISGIISNDIAFDKPNISKWSIKETMVNIQIRHVF